jgi:alginate O-acetyltransferase complex protein AlgI
MVAFAQIFFRAATVGDALHLLRLMVRPLDSGTRALSMELWLPTLVCATAALLVGTGLHLAIWRRLTRGASVLPNWATYAVVMLAIVLLASTGGGQFIYFKF